MKRAGLIFTTVLLGSLAWAQGEIEPTPVKDTADKEDYIRESWTNVGPEKISLDVSISSQDPGWRFVHDGTNLVTAPSDCTGVTWSKFHICECSTLEQCIAVIEKKGLRISEALQEEIDRLEEEEAREAEEREVG